MSEQPATTAAIPGVPQAIELRHLRAFVAVAEELNFSRAAERLYISQPALSRQIRALERLVGCELLRRSSHRVELTAAGAALLDRARGILGDVEVAVSAVQAAGGELVRRVADLWEPVLGLADPRVGLREDPWPRAASRLMSWYLAGHPPGDPIVNPLAADLTGLSPILVQAATGDRLRDDASRLVDRAAAHGVDAQLELYPVDAHVFQLFWSFLPAAADAIRHAGEFARVR